MGDVITSLKYAKPQRIWVHDHPEPDDRWLRDQFGLDPALPGHFEPGARTAWHTHPLGQTLIATTTTAPTQIAIVELLDGKAADWMEEVADEQYRAGSSAE